MSARSSLVEALERAALEADHSADDSAFDAALDAALAQARTEANPGAGLRAAVSHHLRGVLPADAPPFDPSPSPSPQPAAQQTPSTHLSSALAPDAGSLGRDSGIVAIVRESGRSLRAAQGAGLLAVGVAIGFAWGRAPVWQAERRAASEASAAASASSTGSSGANAPGTGSSETSAASASVARGSADDGRDAPRADPADTAPDIAARAASAAADSSARPARRARLGGSGARAPRPAASDDRLRLALQQLRKAQLFLRASEPRRALAALDELDARVPRGVLSEERDATRVLAWCDAGEHQKARALAARLLEGSPESAYAPSLRESCAGRQELLEEMRERTSNLPR